MPKQLNVVFRYQPEIGSSDARLICWMKEYSILPFKEAFIVPCRIFWNPLASRLLDCPRAERIRLVRESMVALEAQLELVKLEWNKLQVEPELLNNLEEKTHG